MGKMEILKTKFDGRLKTKSVRPTAIAVLSDATRSSNKKPFESGIFNTDSIFNL